ncbi:class I SAM-dependent methyltransferase [Castellaniella sp.]|uniref:class I SAM-dependent methyltransferase n=1 Tax=Castellaniella sp. TaxID=1955812 RepID=UPI0035676A15
MTARRATPIELAEWLDTPPGQYVRAWEQRQVDAMVGNAFGYHAIQIGLPHWDLLQANRMPHKVWAHSPDAPYGTRAGRLICEPEQLPFDAQSVDLLVMPHTLEWCQDPHQVLREVERVLVPEGRVVLTGFNPCSLWGVRESLPGLALQLPIPVPLQVSLRRLKDWFKLLSFEVDRGRFGCYVPLCTTQAWLQRWHFLEHAGDRWWPAAGAVYAVAAVKRVAAMHLVGPVWRQSSRRKARRATVAPVTHQTNRKADV